MALGATDAPGIHYVLAGSGRMIVGNHPPIDLVPHTLVILPGGQPFVLEASANRRAMKTLEGHRQTFEPGALRRQGLIIPTPLYVDDALLADIVLGALVVAELVAEKYSMSEKDT
jgi:hypothetical protein